MGVLMLGIVIHAQHLGSPGLQPERKPAPVTPEAMHASVVQTFVRSEGLGLSRMPSVHRSFIPEFALGEKVYRVKLVQLIGMENNPEPTAYITPGLIPEKWQLKGVRRQKNVPTRPLTVFEKDALGPLAGGKKVVFGTNDNRLVMAGSLVTTRECLNCHDGKEGRMLGAMSYALEEVVLPKPEGLKPAKGELVRISSASSR